MVLEETHGDGDFASIFESVAAQRRDQEERRQLANLLKLLEEIERAAPPPPPAALPPVSRFGAPPPPPQVERLRVLASGDIDHERERDATLAAARAEKRGVHTLDDLPRESEFEMLFGAPPPAPPPEPAVVVQSARRLSDGKTFHRLAINGAENLALSWAGLSPETVLLLLGLAVFAMLILAILALGRLRALLIEPPAPQAFTAPDAAVLAAPTRSAGADKAMAMESLIEQEVERRLGSLLRVLQPKRRMRKQLV
jgi:hypothetical protein